MKINKKAIIILVALFPILAMAQIPQKSNLGIPSLPPPVNPNLSTAAVNLINWAFGFLMILAVVFILYAAFLYLTSGGEPDKIRRATSFITYAVVAIIIGAIAYGIIGLVRYFLNI